MAIGIVTCSTSCIPPEIAAGVGVEIVPLVLVIDGREYRDGVDMTRSQFYAALAEDESGVSTSTPTTGSYLEAFRRLERDHDGIFCVTIASRFSASSLAASKAASMITSIPVEVFDCGTAATAQGQVVLAAARRACAGKGMDEVREAAERTSREVVLCAAVDTVEYLKRGGRLGSATAFLAGALNIKPVFRLAGGEIEPVARSLSMKRAIDRMAGEAASASKGGRSLHLAFFHAEALQEALFLKERVESMVEHSDSFLTDFTPVMGRHTGPGVVGLSFY